jgi:hypothetical protein
LRVKLLCCGHVFLFLLLKSFEHGSGFSRDGFRCFKDQTRRFL